MSVFDRRAMFRGFNADTSHQQMAGLASWAAFSARWRARQGLPLLHPLDVQYLTPQDFCNSLGCPLPPEVQRRLFRGYVEAAVRSTTGGVGCRRAGLVSADIALVRVHGFVRWMGERECDFRYGRPDIGSYEFRGDRPYGVPVASETVRRYWLDGSAGAGENENGDESWIEGYRMLEMASD
jgi:hypothetical protein